MKYIWWTITILFSQGGAAVWYNMLANGEGDYSTRHAGCPVLTGQKWGKNPLHHSIVMRIARIKISFRLMRDNITHYNMQYLNMKSNRSKILAHSIHF